MTIHSDAVKRQAALIVLILVLSVAVRTMRTSLAGTESQTLTVWPAQVIFGFYFAILTLSVQALQRLRRVTSHESRRKVLLLLMLVGFSMDLVLVNVQEITGHVDASYGPVVLWDVATFFIWLRVVDLCRPGNDTGFRSAWTVAVAPLFALGREILFLPYKPPQAGLAYLDLLFGYLLASLWVFVPFVRHSPAYEREHGRGFAERMVVLLVFTGCAYLLVSGLENTIGLAYSPFYPSLYRILERNRVPIPVLNCLHFLVAAGITLVFWRWNVLGIGTRFGIRRKKTAAAS